jgi:tetratricopeptide (TPR) repeat protein
MLRTTLYRIATAAISRWRVARILDRARSAKRRHGVLASAEVLLRGVKRYPEEARLWNELAVAQIESQDLESAAQSIRRTLDLCPDLPQGHCNMGIVLAERGEQAAALRSFERAFEIDPTMLAARENYAYLVSKTQPIDATLAAWDEVLRLDPRHQRAHVVKSGVLMCAGRFAEAVESLGRAEQIGGETPTMALYRAVIDADTGKPDRAIGALEALRGKIPDADIDWNLALVYLSQGDFARGWPLYEARPTRSDPQKRRPYGFPEWDGGRLTDGALLVVAEQGLGDEIMFASCYADVIERAPGCVIECDPRLARIFERSFPNAQVVGIARDNDASWTRDYPKLGRQVLAGSLPRMFRSGEASFPRHAGFLRLDPSRVDEWRTRLAALDGNLKVGIAWNGGLDHTRRALRCLPVSDLAGLLRNTRHTIVSLQHDDKRGEAMQLAGLSGRAVHEFPDALADLDEQAALIKALDVIITVCSSVVHLGGAVGARTWVLTPSVAEWRYRNAGETLPWYPTVRLYRQARPGEWGAVLARVSDALSTLESGAERARFDPAPARN